jgi:hypothetical protein
MWDEYIKMNNITDLSKLNWDDFDINFFKSSFFVPKDREMEFKRICEELSIKLSIRNYPRKILLKRVFNNTATNTKVLLSFIKSKIVKMKN